MKTIVEINSTNYASTGNIMLDIAKEARKNGYHVVTCCKASKESYKHLDDSEQLIFGYRFERILSSFLCSITGLRDSFNIFGTISFINKLKKINPDLIHLHVLHDDIINIKILFKYLSKLNIPIIWTFHDCCPFTGKCPAFDMVGCQKWIECCNSCPQLHTNVKSLFDTTSYIWKKRKKCFTSVPNLTIITPSIWLKNAVGFSFFNKYETKIINNGINLDIFKPTISNFKNDYKIKSKYIVLGVANVWNKNKGLDVFLELANKLSNDYQIVLIGTNKDIDNILPKNIISIHRTYNQEELAKIYSAADVFVNPSREDVFGLVNIESLACGTPVVMFKTGGCPETIDDTCGIIVEKNDIDGMYNGITKICENKIFTNDSCINRSKLFSNTNMLKKYIDLYNDKINNQ